MIQLALIMILAPFSAPEIIVDEDGFVTVVESPAEQAKEEKNMDLLAEATRAYHDYRNKGEGDLDEVLAKYERLLESGLEFVPDVRTDIANVLTDLRRERAKISLGITDEGMSPERLRELEEQLSAGAFQDEARDVVVEALLGEKDKSHTPIDRDYRKQIVAQREEMIAELPEENTLEAARLLFELAVVMAELDDAESVKQCAHYYARSREKALEAAMEAARREEQCAKRLLSLLERQKNTALSHEIMEAYSQDSELVENIEQLLSKMELQIEEAEKRQRTAQRPTKEALIEAGDLFGQALMKDLMHDTASVHQCAHNYAKARQTALAAAQFNEVIPLSGPVAIGTGHSQVDGDSMAEQCVKRMLPILERHKDIALCREILESYAEDRELVMEIETVLSKIESQ
ncbi:MAG: hypothetical protein GX130_13030 [Candidatus Hydrogenedens sp.]|jgi:hypothetical protein|nr:hypothetical protein [Candidatus Hydrogenedens sp.]